MSESNRRKDALLGEPHGTANGKLRKALLFKYVQIAGHDVCYRCARRIADVSEFSVEHKVAWQRAADARKAFFDLEDIAFSHLRCNVGIANSEREYRRQEHGLKAYQRGCRCGVCRMSKATLDPRRPTATMRHRDRLAQ